MRAAQRVLAIPELLALILEFTAADNLPEGIERQNIVILYKCTSVNHLWFCETMRHLWSHLTWEKLKALKQMPIEHRQFYAGFIKVRHPSSKYQTQILDGLLFPHVLSVNIRLWDHLTLFYLPPIQAPALLVLDLNVYKVKMTNGHVLYHGSVEKRFAE